MEAAQAAWRPLGEVIVERGLITPEQLEDALLEQRITNKRLGTILIDKGNRLA
jgi:type IV pilus assembly protein PilB